MRPHGTSRIAKFITGLLAITAGALLVAFNTGVLPVAYKSIVFSWQMLLIAIGVVLLFSRHKRGHGVALTLAGGYFILPKFGIEALSFLQGNGWAAVLIIAGTLILYHAIFGHRRQHAHCRRHFERAFAFEQHFKAQHERFRENNHDYIKHNCIFGGSNEKINSQSFKGGEVNCVFGGTEIDLTNAQLAEGVNTLDVSVVFGGITLYIPAHWKVTIQQEMVFGQIEDHRLPATFEVDEKRMLVIIASAIFGGGEIKSK
ncbi:MAG: cell wall-active antibiotics response protein [Prevotellaceae bacterium]|nr:cell wall-active antibiotics response protein [Prevotellaceae bacterium]